MKLFVFGNMITHQGNTERILLYVSILTDQLEGHAVKTTVHIKNTK